LIAQAGATVVFTSRDPQKGERAATTTVTSRPPP
jgi:hypothetical protein